MTCRAGEEDKTHFRTDRYYCIDGKWYFTTREKIEMGPFDTHKDAESELMLYMRHSEEGGLYEDMHKAAAEGRLDDAQTS